MKKIFIILILLFNVCLFGCDSKLSSDYLRVHIRANSNSEEDQKIKYFIKDVFVEYMSPKLRECESKTEAIEIINENKIGIEKLIDGVLKENGFNYGCSIEINNEFFPTRVYDDLTLEADYYDAVIVKLGSAVGNNWWCVVYPNLCFNEPTNVVYKSKIVEIINKIKG